MLKIHSSEYSFIFGGSVAMKFNEDVARQTEKKIKARRYIINHAI
jgi:hypothetical protein